MASAARSMVVASARTTAAEIAARWCARKVRGEDRERPYRVESWVVGARACLPSGECSQRSVGRAVEGGGERVLCRAVGRECFFQGEIRKTLACARVKKSVPIDGTASIEPNGVLHGTLVSWTRGSCIAPY